LPSAAAEDPGNPPAHPFFVGAPAAGPASTRKRHENCKYIHTDGRGCRYRQEKSHPAHG